MRTTNILFILAVLFSAFSFGQEAVKADAEKPKKKKTYKITEKQLYDSITSFNYKFKDDDGIESLVDKIKYDKRNPLARYVDNFTATTEVRKNYTVLYNGKSLNLLFADKLGTVFNASNDLSLQKTYFNVDASEKSFSFGYNFDNRGGNPLKQLNWLFSVGTKVVSSDGFATIATGGDLAEDNIGLNLKISWVGNGTIGWSKTNNHKEKIKTYREFLYYTYNEKVKAYNKVLPKIVEQNETIYSKTNAEKKITKAIEEKSDALFLEMIQEELKYIESNSLYTRIWNHWFTLEGYIPLGDQKYKITPISASNEPTEALYYAFNTNLSWNIYTQYNKDISWFGKFTGTIKGNNNIAVDGLEAEEFQSITTVNGEPTLTAPVKAIDIDAYDRFVTSSLKTEVAIFYKNTIGISPSIEKNFGTYDGLNWKIGVPVSLKDKEGKPTVNFELQWKEVKTLTSHQHLIGFSTSFFFGDLIKKK